MREDSSTALVSREPAVEGVADEDEPSCRICWGTSVPEDPLVQPCHCAGSLRWVHRTCNAEWLRQSKRATCEVRGGATACAAADARLQAAGCRALRTCVPAGCAAGCMDQWQA